MQSEVTTTTPLTNGRASAHELEALEAQLVEVLEAREAGPAIERPAGPAAAVVLAAGLAAFVLGVLSTLADASAPLKSFLTFDQGVGDLSGESTISSIVFFAAWGALALAWRRSSPALRPIAIATGILVVVGLAGTFPLVIQAFATGE